MRTLFRLGVPLLALCSTSLLLAAGPAPKNFKFLGNVQGALQSVSLGQSDSGGTMTLRVPRMTLAPSTPYGHPLWWYLKPKDIVNPRMPPQMRAGQLELDPRALLRSAAEAQMSVNVQVIQQDIEVSLASDLQARWYRPINGKYDAKASDLSVGQNVIAYLILPVESAPGKPLEFGTPTATRITIVNNPAAKK